MKIKKIESRQILDSRGNPTIECKLQLEDGKIVVSSVPSGASTGSDEVFELRDNNKNYYCGKSVLKAIININTIFAKKFTGQIPDIKKMDDWMIECDGTMNKANLGANAILAVSLAVTRAQAHIEKKELFSFINKHFEFKEVSMPTCMFNIINGGAHSNSGLAFQEFMIVPKNYSSIDEQLSYAITIYNELKRLLSQNGFLTTVGDEGGFAPKLSSQKQALDFIMQAIKNCSLENHICLALDVAATTFFDKKRQKYIFENKELSIEKMVDFYSDLIKKYPIISIEDGLAEDDINGWKLITKELGQKIMIIGDDLFVTNSKKLQDGIDNNYANSILIKPNQIGTVSETIKTIKLAQKNNYKIIVSHRSGETNDSFISDLAVGSGAKFIKAGAPCRGERVAKYNRLLEI